MQLKILLLLTIGIWIGMVFGISFVEAPLKFQAPNITLTLGLGIGQLVFSALNKIEIFFSIVVLCCLMKHSRHLELVALISLGIPIVLVGLQSFWLLPELNFRVTKRLANITIPSSNHHLYYIIMEVSKVIFLTIGFIKTYDQN